MLINEDNGSVIINGINMTQYIKDVKFGFHKMWGKGSGRNLAQSVVGSFNIFPKITLTFRKLNQTEMEVISPIINSQTQNVSYYDTEYKEVVKMSTYTNDLEYVQKNIGKVDNFNVAFVSRKRRVR